MNCGNYRGIKLICHSLKLYESVHKNRLRNSISEEQFGFMKGKSTTDVIYVLQQLQERYRDIWQDLHFIFIDLGKAYVKNCIGVRETRGYQRSTSDW